MTLSNDERFTYANMYVMEIKRKLEILNPEMKEPFDIEVVNLALIIFSIICDAHAHAELERHDIVEDMLDNKADFLHYVNDLIQQSNDTNEVLNNYIKNIEVKK